MPTYLWLQRNNDQNTPLQLPKTSPNTRGTSWRTAQKACPVLPRTEPRDNTLGPTGYPSADTGIVDRLPPRLRYNKR